MALLTVKDMEKIEKAWGKRLTRARFGYDSGICQRTGQPNGFVTLYVCDDEVQLDHDFKSGTPYLLSMFAYRKIKSAMDKLYPPPPPPPKPPKKAFVPRAEKPKEAAPLQN
jgi:hypothetical protein